MLGIFGSAFIPFGMARSHIRQAHDRKITSYHDRHLVGCVGVDLLCRALAFAELGPRERQKANSIAAPNWMLDCRALAAAAGAARAAPQPVARFIRAPPDHSDRAVSQGRCLVPWIFA
jgi:hypothetical protein